MRPRPRFEDDVPAEPGAERLGQVRPGDRRVLADGDHAGDVRALEQGDGDIGIGKALPGISPYTLTSRLRQFETHGNVVRTAYAEIPPMRRIPADPLGEGLRDVLDAMNAWAQAVPDPYPEPDAVT
ncbi:winged helix-turn-helix transcriptional regulator [Streptomyces europaeiscabiei]|uniref:Winged helix-turn-helix transcriptional regulator n=1 Tax=Streptomyces europaeiscabiei TaxID=146819 RepID=A0AAJ2PKC7_9ACTN|nr:winged helix-turn-helix transcriptional regulator [Streptomyces europaeiscabiei]MDX3128601.1 winged helix-turn-helix transcriptional regulator [Streptomyces europaeiscabiei]